MSPRGKTNQEFQRKSRIEFMFTIREFLHQEVKPALGCTEPGAVALAVAAACEQLSGRAERLKITVSDNIFKNGIAVGVPGTHGARGNVIAAALAVFCGRSRYGLEVLKDADAENLAQARAFVKEDRITLETNGRGGVYVRAEAYRNGENGVAVIEKTHANITYISQNGEIIYKAAPEKENSSTAPVTDQVKKMNFEELVALASRMDDEDRTHIWDGIDMNLRIADYGFKHPVGLQLGRTIKAASGKNYETDLAAQVKAVAAAASDARMEGISLPVMSSAGSGNHGITAILPVYVVGKYYGKSRDEIAEAVAYSHLATSFVKSRMGRLSPVCGCAVAAGAGASAGIVHILGGTDAQAKKAMELVLGNITGMLCDGAKESCALKVGTGATEAFYAAQIALAGGGMTVSQGVVDVNSFTQTAENAARLNAEGMKNVDHTIIDIITHRA